MKQWWKNLFSKREVKIYVNDLGYEITEQEYYEWKRSQRDRLMGAASHHRMRHVPVGESHGDKSQQNNNKQQTIQYRSELVPELKDEHRELVERYLLIGALFSNRDYPRLKQELKRFKVEFNTHIVKENLYFYVYLEQTMGMDSENREIIRDFRREMNHIARLVKKFISRYVGAEFTADVVAQFARDYEAMKGGLVERIESEENNLYTLYSPPERNDSLIA